MPTVPKVTQRQVQVRPVGTSFSRSDLPLSAAGGQEARALAGLAQGAQAVTAEADRVANKIIDEDNDRQVKLLDSEMSEFIRGVGFGSDTQPGFYASKANTTINAAPDAKQRLLSERKARMDGIQNPAVQKKFAEVSQARLDREFANIDRHTAQQRVAANQQASEARMEEAIEDGIAYTDPHILARSAAIVDVEIAGQAADNGWSPEVQASEKETALTQLYNTAIRKAIVDGDISAAQELMAKHGPVMDGVIRAQTQQFLDKAATDQAVFEEVESMLKAGMTEAEALTAARKEGDKTKRDAVVKEVTGRYAEKSRLEREQIKGVKRDAYQAVWDGQDLDAWARQNPDAFVLLDPRDVAQIERAELKRKKGELFSSITDGTSFNELTSLSTSDLASADLQEWQHRLTESEFSKAQTAVKAAQQRVEKSQQSAAGYSRADSVLIRFAPASLNVNKVKQTPEQHALENRLRNSLYSFVSELADEGKVPTQQDLATHLQRQMIEFSGHPGVGLSRFFGFHDPVFKTMLTDLDALTSEQKSVAWVDPTTLPADLVDQLRGALRSKGKTADAEGLGNFAAAYLLGDQARMVNLINDLPSE